MVLKNLLLAILVCSCSMLYASEVGESGKKGKEIEKKLETEKDYQDEIEETRKNIQELDQKLIDIKKTRQRAESMKPEDPSKARIVEDAIKALTTQIEETQQQINESNRKLFTLKDQLNELKIRLRGLQQGPISQPQESLLSKFSTLMENLGKQVQFFFKNIRTWWYENIWRNPQAAKETYESMEQLSKELTQDLETARKQKKLSQLETDVIQKAQKSILSLESYKTAMDKLLPEDQEKIKNETQELALNLLALREDTALAMELGNEEYARLEADIDRLFKVFGFDKQFENIIQNTPGLPDQKPLTFTSTDGKAITRGFIDINKPEYSLSGGKSFAKLIDERSKDKNKKLIITRITIPEKNVVAYYDADAFLNAYLGQDYINESPTKTFIRNEYGQLSVTDSKNNKTEVSTALGTGAPIGKNKIEFYMWTGQSFDYIGNDGDLPTQYVAENTSLEQALRKNKPSRVGQTQQPPQ